MTNDPLEALIGVWKGSEGIDIAPEPDGTDENPYYETITFSRTDELDNAETQELTAVQYRQVVQRKSNDKVFHDQSGYWIWEEETGLIMHSFSIPRGVCVLAGGGVQQAEGDANTLVFEVSASVDSEDWKIIESPFMRDNARTLSFRQKMTVSENKLVYSQTSVLDIYGRRFDHTDDNELIRQ